MPPPSQPLEETYTTAAPIVYETTPFQTQYFAHQSDFRGSVIPFVPTGATMEVPSLWSTNGQLQMQPVALGDAGSFDPAGRFDTAGSLGSGGSFPDTGRFGIPGRFRSARSFGDTGSFGTGGSFADMGSFGTGGGFGDTGRFGTAGRFGSARSFGDTGRFVTAGTFGAAGIGDYAGSLGTVATTTDAGQQVRRELAAIMMGLQNPSPTQDQLRQVVSRFQPAPVQTVATGDKPSWVVPDVPRWSVLGSASPMSGSGLARYPYDLQQRQSVGWAQRDATAPELGATSDYTDPTLQGTTGDYTYPALRGTTSDYTYPALGTTDTVARSRNSTSVLPSDAGNYDLMERCQNVFISQNPSQWNVHAPERQIANGLIEGNYDCGPASFAMALRLLGRVNGPIDGSNSEDLISEVRKLMTNADDHFSQTTLQQLESAAAKCGLQAKEVTGLDGINAALDRKHLVISYGNPGDDGSYGNALGPEKYRQYNGNHIMLIAGRQGQNYVVCDPLSRVGAFVVTPEQLQAYIKDRDIGLHGGVELSPA